MITWLFTQVWLWSLAAFLLGAFVTWALFVRPVRRRLKAELARPRYLEPAYAEPSYAEVVYDEPVHEDAVYEDAVYEDEQVVERQPAPLDLLEQSRQWEAPEEQTRQWEAPEEQAPQAPQWEAPEEQQLEEWDRKPRPWVAPEAIRTAPADTQRLPEPEAPAGDNTWFRNPEVEETRAESRPSQFPPGADEEDSGQLSGQLRSLFEPESAPDAQEPYTPPIGADATQVIPAVPREQEQSSQVTGNLDEGAGESRPLPKRTPQPRSDSAQQLDPPKIPEALRRHVEDGRPLPKSDDADDPADIKLVDNPDDSAPLPRRTPGAGPHPGRDTTWESPSATLDAQGEPSRTQPQPAGSSAPAAPSAKAAGTGSAGPMIKGHSASRQYHSPDSPQYDQITADVWFRTPADAEIAGFEPWYSNNPRP